MSVLMDHDVRDGAAGVLNMLPPSEQKVIRMRFGIGYDSEHTLEQIAQVFGLSGPQGVLPLAYSLYVADRVRAGDHALKEFLGIFDHRMLSLFYRAWEKTHVSVSYGAPGALYGSCVTAITTRPPAK